MARNFTIEAGKKRPYIPGMMLATVIALRELGGVRTIPEINAQVVKVEGVTEEEQTRKMSTRDRLKFNYYLLWARTYLKYCNGLENTAYGKWALTEDCLEILTLEDAESAFEIASRNLQTYNNKRRTNKKQKLDTFTDELLDEIDTLDDNQASPLSNERCFIIKPTGTPDYPVMMLATIRALKDLGGLATISDIAEQVIKNENVSEEEQSYPQTGDNRSKLNFALTFARASLKRYNALEKPAFRFWKLTDVGLKIDSLAELDALYKADNSKRAKKAQAKKLQKEKQQEDDVNLQEDDVNLIVETDDLDDASTLDNDGKTTLLTILKGMDSGDFELLCKILLIQAGFSTVTLSGKATAADGGIDGIGILPINLVSFHVCFQCKCWTDNTVRSKDIRDFRGALQGRADKGLFITTSNFTNDATKESIRDGALTIDLINGNRLCDLLKEYKIEVEPQDDKIIHITKNGAILSKFTLPTPNPQQQGN